MKRDYLKSFTFFYFRRPEVHLGYDLSFLTCTIQAMNKTEIKREKKRDAEKDRMNER